MPLAPRLFSFPFFSTTPSLFLSLFPGKLRGNRQILGSEPSLRLVWAQNQPNFRPNRQNTGNFAENPCRPGNYPATAWVFCRFLNFASDFAPDQLSDSGKLASFQNGAPNTLCFPWKFPETQSAGDPLFSFLFAGKACAGQIGTCAVLDRVARHKDPRNCDSPLSSRCDPV